MSGYFLGGLAEPDKLDILRRLFTDPETLRPGQTTEAVAADFPRTTAEVMLIIPAA